jgi:hypothetical protein
MCLVSLFLESPSPGLSMMITFGFDGSPLKFVTKQLTLEVSEANPFEVLKCFFLQIEFAIDDFPCPVLPMINSTLYSFYIDL